MRVTIFAFTVAITCCGFSSLSFAQTTRLTTSPTLAPGLQLGTSDVSAQQSTRRDESRSDETIKPSPFDIFGQDSSRSANEAALSETENAEPAALKFDSNSSAQAAPGKAVGRRAQSGADTIIAGAQAVNANSNYFPPIDWNSGMHRAPNPTADYMLRQYCVDGLWDNYGAERAQQCARQMERIYGGHRHCQGCGVHAGHAGCQSCQVGTQHNHRVNRYRQPSGNCGQTATGCDSAGAVNSNGCTQCAGWPGPMPQPLVNESAQNAFPQSQPTATALTAPQTQSQSGKVASLPAKIR